MAKTGRPTDNPKPYRKTIRLSDKDIEKLQICIKETGRSESEVVRMGIDMVYQEVSKKKKAVAP